MKSRAGRHPVRRAVLVSVCLALALLSVYPVAANLFLRLGGVQKAFAGTDSVKVDFRRGWSFWPGRAHVEDVQVTMQDRNVQFFMRIPRADVEIDLWALKERTFHLTRVRASGIVFRFRHRIDPESAAAPSVAAYPPIPGFLDPPLREAGPPEAPLTEEKYNLWTVHIDDVDVHVRELWAQMIRYEGDAHVKGAFRLRPAKRLWVGPAELEFRSGTMTAGHHDILYDMRGSLVCKVDDFDTESAHGMDPFRFVFTRLQLSAQVANLAAVNFLSAPSAAFQLEDGSGALDMNVAVDHGKFTADSSLNYRTGHIGVRDIPFPFRLDGEVAVRLQGPAAGPGGQLMVEIPEAVLHLGKSRHAPPRLSGVEASLATSSVDVAEDWSITRRDLRFREVAFADLRWLNDLPVGKAHGFQIDGGRGHVRGVATFPPSDAIEGSVSARLEDASGHAATFKFRTTADVIATAQSNGRGAVSGTGRVAASQFELSTDDGASTRAARAVIDADVSFSKPGAFSGQLRAETGEWMGEFGDSRVMASSLSATAQLTPENVTAVANLAGIRLSALGACPWAEIGAASIAGQLETPREGDVKANVRAELSRASLQWGSFNTLAGRTILSGAWTGTDLSARLDANDLRMKSAGGAPRGWEAAAKSASVATHLAIAGGIMEGPAQIAVEQLDGTVGKTRVRGDIVGDLDLNSRDASLRIADISGTVQTRNVAVSTKQREINGWWAEFKVEKAHLDTRQNLDVAGKVKARFRDALPALYVLASEDEIPAWVPSILPLEGLSFDLGVERYCRWTDVQVNDARGGPLAAQGRLQVEPGETRGALLLRLAAFKPISLGLSFVEDYSSASPLAGAGWLEKHMIPLTSAARQKHDTACAPEPPACR